MRHAARISLLILSFTVGLPTTNLLAAAAESGPIDSANLTGTTVVPHVQVPIESNKNVLYCSAFQLAWKEFRKANPGRPGEEPETVQALDETKMTEADLAEESYVAAAGAVSRVIDEINQRLKAKFDDAAPVVAPPAEFGPDALFAYAFLYKNLRFESAFESLVQPLLFVSGGTGGLVESFGIQNYAAANARHRALADQVAILDYRSDRDFIVRLKSTAPDDDIILAMVKPGKTLGETVRAVEQRVAMGEEESLRDGDDLRVPKFDFDLKHSFDEIAGYVSQAVEGPAKAFQQIRFRLDQRGATVKSEARIVAKSMAPAEPRNLAFNRPFLLYLKQKSGRRPYLAVWVGNPELLIAAPSPATAEDDEPDARRLILQRCTLCHDLQRVDEAVHDFEGWSETIDRMIGNGAKLDKAERGAVIEYLRAR